MTSSPGYDLNTAIQYHNFYWICARLAVIYSTMDMILFIELGIADLAVVRKALFDVRAKWYHIGIELGLPVGTLDAIRTQFTDLTDCVTEMCSKWLKGTHPSPTWDDLIKAVESPFVGEICLAQKLRKTYCQEQEGIKTDTSLGQSRGTAAQGMPYHTLTY